MLRTGELGCDGLDGCSASALSAMTWLVIPAPLAWVSSDALLALSPRASFLYLNSTTLISLV